MDKNIMIGMIGVFAAVALALAMNAHYALADPYSDGDYIWTAENILRPAWNNIIGLWGESGDEAIVPGMFGYTLKGWEVNVCSMHVTGDTAYKPPDGFNGISTDLRMIYDTSATLQAMGTDEVDNQTLIEVAWYIQPKSETSYSVYLLKGTTKEYILQNRPVDPAQGETGYKAEYYDTTYDYAVLAYSDGRVILKQEIVNVTNS